VHKKKGVGRQKRREKKARGRNYFPRLARRLGSGCVCRGCLRVRAHPAPSSVIELKFPTGNDSFRGLLFQLG